MQIHTALSYPGCALPSPPPLCTSMKGTIYPERAVAPRGPLFPPLALPNPTPRLP